MPLTRPTCFAACLLSKSTRSGLFCLAFVCASLSCCVAAEGARRGSLSPAIDDLVEQQISAYHIPGLSIAVTLRGRIIFSRGYGWADLESHARVTRGTLFRIGSITKPITATAAMLLAERRQLDLDAPVQNSCSSFPEKPWPVTTRELLGHLGSIRGFQARDRGPAADLLSSTHYDSVRETVALFASEPLASKRGTHYEYSNYGYDLVGCVLEGASGKSFEDVLRSVVFEPAGMAATRLDDNTRVIPGRSRWYTHARDGGVTNARYLDTSNRVPAAGLLSTADDLARFVLALEAGKLLPAAEVRQMWTEQSTEAGKRTGYALGWMIHQHNGTSVIAHTGELPGASTILYVIPDKGSSSLRWQIAMPPGSGSSPTVSPISSADSHHELILAWAPSRSLNAFSCAFQRPFIVSGLTSRCFE